MKDINESLKKNESDRIRWERKVRFAVNKLSRLRLQHVRLLNRQAERLKKQAAALQTSSGRTINLEPS